MEIINTFKCNFRCKHCCVSASPDRNEFIKTEYVEKFITDYYDGSGQVGYCGGETFLHPEWEEHLMMLVDKFNIIRVTTNGTLLVNNKEKTPVYNSLIGVYEYSKKKGVLLYCIVSDDRFHQEEAKERGIDLFYIIEELNRSIPELFVKDCREDSIAKFAALGRAVSNKCYDYDGVCMIGNNKDGWFNTYKRNITIDPNGNIHGCCALGSFCGHISEPTIIVKERLKRLKRQESCLKCGTLKK